MTMEPALDGAGGAWPPAAEAVLLREAIRHSANHIAVFDPQGRLAAWSDMYERFHAEVFDSLRAQGRLHAVRFEEFVRLSLGRQYRGERLETEVASRCTAHAAADGVPRERFIPGRGWYQITKFRTPSGATVTVGVDISALKAKEAELEAARAEAEAANAAKSVFLANMSHEFRTPMNGVLGMAALLDRTALDARQREYLAVLRDSATAMLGLIDDVLDLARIEAGRLRLRPRPFAPAAVVGEVAALLGAGLDPARLAIETQMAAELPDMVEGDPLRFRQVLWNLVGNAVKYTPRGRILVTLAGAADEDGRFLLRCVVDDTGPGVPEAARAEIFERFRQAHPPGDRRPGAGLGLAICRSLVEMMDGRIGVETSPLGGARFWFEAPLPAAGTLDAAGAAS